MTRLGPLGGQLKLSVHTFSHFSFWTSLEHAARCNTVPRLLQGTKGTSLSQALERFKRTLRTMIS